MTMVPEHMYRDRELLDQKRKEEEGSLSRGRIQRGDFLLDRKGQRMRPVIVSALFGTQKDIK